MRLAILFISLRSSVQNILAAIPGTIMYLATPELYTTKYRAVGLGSCSVVARMGGE